MKPDFVGAASSRDGIALGVYIYRGWKPLQRKNDPYAFCLIF
jgi:hypothetical protein